MPHGLDRARVVGKRGNGMPLTALIRNLEDDEGRLVAPGSDAKRGGRAAADGMRRKARIPSLGLLQQ